ncbi:DUF7848 domain-containing protein [Streptacidiphilus albus]|uniref:DUF7848 domain-containing protein n=1 Tax=Streptacidiphilus albus TaxID=105425 RepID=UPI00128E47A7|nr:hypothetical protein [Streptacidiphilus albus]
MRSVIRRAMWLIARDDSPVAAQELHVFACLAEECGKQSETLISLEDCQDWAIRHSGLNPGHRAFTQTTMDKHWTTSLVDGS